MSLKRDAVILLLQHGAKKVVQHIEYKDAEKEVIRINQARFPEMEFHLVPSKHKKLSQLIKKGWRDALVDPNIGPGVHFPQEFLGKKLLLFRETKSGKRIGFI